MRSEILSRSSGSQSRLLRGSLALLLSAVVPAQAVAFAAPGRDGPQAARPGGSKPAAISLFSDQRMKAEVASELLDAFQKGGQVTYLVKLRTRADVQTAATSAREGASPAAAELQARSAVINSLREAAESTQAGLISFLKQAQDSGEVAEFEPFWVANMIAVTSDQATMERIAKLPEVEKILPDSKIFLVGGDAVKAGAVAADPSGTPETQAVEWNIDRVGAPLVWQQFGIDGAGTVVASLDTGVEGTHPALRTQYRGGDSSDPIFNWFDAVNGRSQPYDDHGHGTHTTGTMVGRDESGANEIGVAPGAQWIAAKILSAAGTGSAQNILRAGQWALAPGGDPAKAPDVVNNSWGGGPGVDEWFRDIVSAWRAAGIVPVFANGNDGPGTGTVSVPANYPESIGVGATDRTDGLASFSGRGPSPYGEVKPELSAPGVNVRSAVPGGGYEGGWNGTSMAAPHVAGAVALIRQANAALSVDEIEALLTESADPTTNAQYPSVPNNGYGHGILNAYNAVGRVANGIGAVSGRLMTGGDDLNAPTITHTPVAEGFKWLDIPVEAEVADDVSLTAVYLRFRQPGMNWWGIIDMERRSGDHKGGTYTAVIPGEMATAGTLEYYIEAVDYGNNHALHGSKQKPHVIQLLNGLTPGYLQDFEGAAIGWQTAGSPADLWQIGVPTSGPNAAHSGSQVAATNLSGNYPANAQAFLISPPIDLSGGPAALRFYHWYQMEQNYDKGLVAITTDGGQNWQILQQYTGASGGQYREAVVDLSAYAGNPAVFLAFVLTTDGSSHHPGWYIDDVELYIDTVAPAAPANLSAQPTPVGSVALTWDAVAAGDLSRYTIYRSTESGTGYVAIGESTSNSFSDSTAAAGSTYYYVVTATDLFGNESAHSNEASASPAEVITRFFDDMEAGPGAWTHSGTNDPWEWGVPTSGPGSAASGQNLWATRLGGDYSPSSNASLVSAPIDLSGLSAVNLQFTHWYRLERNYDFGRVEISADGGATWTQLAQYTSPGSGGQPVGWESPLIDLGAYAGQTVQIRFRITSDSSVNYPGWYIDDVRVAGTAAGGNRIEMSLSVEADPVKEGEKPAEATSLHLPLAKPGPATYRIDNGTESIGVNSLPVQGSVTVVETGRVVRTNPADGSYSITLPAGSYTLRGEAYGYYPQERQVEIADGAEVSANFVLEAIPRGTITGTVTNQRDGEPIEGARVRVVEDLRIPETFTGANGQFTLDVLAGSYTVQVSHPDFYPDSATADVPGNGSVDVSIALRPFVGMPGEIAYDDGVAENAWAFYDAGNGWGVRMTPKPGQTAFVSGARVYLWDASWPGGGGRSFAVAIYAANPDGTPGALLAGPVAVENGTLGGWNEIDLSEYGVAVNGDFYVGFFQTVAHPNTPGLGFDESSDSGRTMQFVSGAWSPWTEGGNAMIRAVVTYGIGAPTITTPTDNSFTNQTEVAVEGMGIAGTMVTLFVDGAAAAEVAPGADGQFAATLSLAEGSHELTAAATVPDGGTTDPSAPVRVTVDLTAPELTIAAPAEGQSQNHRLLTVNGQAVDINLAEVTVNGTAATVGDDGQFTTEIIIQEGENQIEITATDRAGNATSVARTVVVDSAKPELTNLQPAADQDLKAGDSLTLSFESEPGLALAAFKLVVDLGAGRPSGDSGEPSLEPGETALTEVSPGYYEAAFTVPEGMLLPQAYVQFRAVDAAGNTTRATAPGVLHIGEEGGNPGEGPQAVIAGPETAKVRKAVSFDGTQSTSQSEIVSYRWDLGDGSKPYTTPTVKHSWKKAGTYTVTLTVTDSTGATDTATLIVTVTR